MMVSHPRSNSTFLIFYLSFIGFLVCQWISSTYSEVGLLQIRRDFIEDILVQGARMKDVLQQLQNVTKVNPDLSSFA